MQAMCLIDVAAAVAPIAPAVGLAAVGERDFRVEAAVRDQVSDPLRVIVRGVDEGDRLAVGLGRLEADRGRALG